MRPSGSAEFWKRDDTGPWIIWDKGFSLWRLLVKSVSTAVASDAGRRVS